MAVARFDSRIAGKRFRRQIDNFKGLMIRKSRRVVQDITTTVAVNIIEGGQFSPGTPVDTSRAKGSWVGAINSEQTAGAIPDSLDKYIGRPSLTLIREVIARMNVGDKIRFDSFVPYMTWLEVGHSDQAPVGFIRLTFNAIPTIVSQAAAKQRARRR